MTFIPSGELVQRSVLVSLCASGADPVPVGVAPGPAPEPPRVPSGGVVVTAEPVTEATKKVRDGLIVTSVDRDALVRAVTPYWLERETLAGLLETSADEQVDVVGLIAAAGGPVVVLPGSPA